MSRITTSAQVTSLGLLALALFSACSRESAAPVEPTPAAGAPAAREDVTVVAEYCGVCHVSPRPQAHVAAEWPAVVSRMQDHRRRTGLAAIPPEDLERIMSYLQQTGGDR